MNKDLYCITLIGCDDETEFEMELTQEEAKLVKHLFTATIEKSSYNYIPTLVITKIKEENINEER